MASFKVAYYALYFNYVSKNLFLLKRTTRHQTCVLLSRDLRTAVLVSYSFALVSLFRGSWHWTQLMPGES
jgi:hypothetical protein